MSLTMGKHRCIACICVIVVSGLSLLNIERVSLATNILVKKMIAEQNRTDYDLSKVNRTFIAWDGIDEMYSMVSGYWNGNPFCDKINETRSEAGNQNLPITANFTFGCREMFEQSYVGTGNFIALFYGLRLVAHVLGNIEIFIICDDADETKEDLILPWLTGWFPARPLSQNSSIQISVKEACGSYATQPLAYMYKEIQHDLRKMAIGLMGVPSTDHASTRFAESNVWPESIAGVQTPRGKLAIRNPRRNDVSPYPASIYGVDDAVLHFRCGDLMDLMHPKFSFLKFDGYTRHISPDVASIGIVTQPFDADTQSRKPDSQQYKMDRCRTVVYSLVEYIKMHFPSAKVRIHNAIGETIALTYARMIMANQTIAGVSSFGIIPAIATFGTGYILKPASNEAPNQWLIHPRIDHLTNNVVLFYERKQIRVGQIKKLWQTKGESSVLDWFWNGTM